MAMKHKKNEPGHLHNHQPPPLASDRVLNGDSSSSGSGQDHRRNKYKKRRNELEPHKKGYPTVSIALPGSIIDNAQSLELATRLAGQVARAATIFRIDEVVVFDNKDTVGNEPADGVKDGIDDYESGAAFLIRILQYLETPQYLRKALFPMHNIMCYVVREMLEILFGTLLWYSFVMVDHHATLKPRNLDLFSCLHGVLPPLDAPHHLRMHEWASYREGVTLRERPLNASHTLVDIGLKKNVCIDQVFEPGVRVTIAMGTDRNLEAESPHQVVSSSEPREEAGMYWGYKVRYASNLSSVVKECPYSGGYDYLIGTSEHGQVVKSSELIIPSFRHLLIAFGGRAGLEENVEEDGGLEGKTVQDFFDVYLNVCPHQGSRTIRTEEAILISLQFFQEPIERSQGMDK